MASLPPLQSFVREHVVDGDGNIDADRLLFGLNQFMGSAYAALNGGIRLKDNGGAAVVSARFVVPNYPWTSVSSFSNSWVNYGGGNYDAAHLVLPNGHVWLRGHIKSGTVGSSAFTLPTGYRPQTAVYRATPSNAAFGELVINGDGTVVPAVGSNTWFNIDCLFEATSPACPLPFSGGEWPILVKHGLPKCTGLIPMRAEVVNGGKTETVGHYTLDWYDKGDGQAVIRSAYGLQPGKPYKLTLLALQE